MNEKEKLELLSSFEQIRVSLSNVKDSFQQILTELAKIDKILSSTKEEYQLLLFNTPIRRMRIGVVGMSTVVKRIFRYNDKMKLVVAEITVVDTNEKTQHVAGHATTSGSGKASPQTTQGQWDNYWEAD